MTTRTQSQSGDRERKKGGRPRLPDGEKRDRPVKVYFDRANYAKLVHRSRRTGRPLSEIVYELAVNGYVKEPLSRDTTKWLRALAGMANNLNQLAHLGHIHGPQHIADENRRLSRMISNLIVKLNEQL
ncbi:plasmid mobilization protein [Bacteroides ovatus]|uniref:plasmid mobilization protein n=1 Tax=Bacteroides ovatus TaxID=28116 RepID=UPI00359C1F88